MAELPLDVVEQILLLLDVKDVIRCKSVCKSWKSLLTSPPFVKAHLNHAYHNDRHNHDFTHRRICFSINATKDGWFYGNYMWMVGSCDGLVCVSPRDAELVVTNPSTGGEERKLPMPPFQKNIKIRPLVCWGFGFDSYADDYKVIAGSLESIYSKRTLFHALTLKSNTWKVIGEVEWKMNVGRSGILCGGALHWFMTDKDDKKVIISLDLSTEKFKEIPVPPLDLYLNTNYFHRLGVIEDCLCIYLYNRPLASKKWVMKNNKWELYNDHCESKYDVAHHLTAVVDSQKEETNCVYNYDDGTCVPGNGYYIGTSVFVKSLVSPYPHVNMMDKKGMPRCLLIPKLS
ncbi:putative F-box domain-containing protein [Helianthus anomalus]